MNRLVTGWFVFFSTRRKKREKRGRERVKVKEKKKIGNKKTYRIVISSKEIGQNQMQVDLDWANHCHQN